MCLTAGSFPQQQLTQLRRLRRRALKCQPCWYSQTPRRKRAKALFRRQPGACSVPRATTQRRHICASRCCRDMVSVWIERLLPLTRGDVSSARVGRRRAAFESSPEERSASGSLRACCLSAASLQARRWCEYRSRGGSAAALKNRFKRSGVAGSHKVPDDLGSAATASPCARDVATNAAFRW